jgi:hypothetical protein
VSQKGPAVSLQSLGAKIFKTQTRGSKLNCSKKKFQKTLVLSLVLNGLRNYDLKTK